MRIQVNRKLTFSLTTIFLLSLAVSGLQAADSASSAPNAPIAKEILAKVRINQSTQHRVLNGRLRHEGTVIPFQLTLDGDTISYHFSNPPQTLILKLGDSGSRLLESSGGDVKKVSAAKNDTEIRGMNITYQDLSLDFLYWPRATLLGEDHMLTRRCWKLRLQTANRRASQYSTVILWVEQQSGALLKADCYDWSGKLRREFTVISVQHDDAGNWILKKMRIQEMQNGDAVGTPTYLEIASH